MVLKRQRDGEFVQWTPAGQTAPQAPTPAPALMHTGWVSSSQSSYTSTAMANSDSTTIPSYPSASTSTSTATAPTSQEPPTKRTRTRSSTGVAPKKPVQAPTTVTDILEKPKGKRAQRKSAATTAGAASKAKGKGKQVQADADLTRPSTLPSTAETSMVGRDISGMGGTRIGAASMTPLSASYSTTAQSASTLARTSTQPAKKPGKKKAAAESPAPAGQPEKRLAQFKPKCPQNILDRVERVMSQRIFMLTRERVDGELKEEFKILGSTGNAYTVVIDHKPRCDCPDHLKGNHCKHILFVFLKVLQVPQRSGLWYQKALLTSELEEIFANAPPAPNSLAHPHVRAAFARAMGKEKEGDAPAEPEASQGKRRIPGEDDDCPICYDSMYQVAEAKLTFCEECGNALHLECFQQWSKTSAATGKALTCVWCRSPWSSGARAASATPLPGGATMQKGVWGRSYVNLAGVSGISPQRDTSSYYHGPRRGQRYRGYQDYDD
ncbi:hypothetical protein BDQ12DRAFT_690526 [Crucibulum laeve]|uniref:SWIM-type domain-containing protein n=1 Tax=Crucibulum laeve TaxID=68775 RepID=A0A5C3LMR0_9AGAR|nr:hypothetical protein BDQ12DRAFT_690526 [Crucibulum laeve]